MEIADLKKQPNKTMIVHPGIFAFCADVLERRTGTGQYGDWSLQPISLKDNSGEIKAIIWNKPDLAALKGKEIHLSALLTDKGWSGCLVEDNQYQGKTYKQIKASGNFLLEEHRPAPPASGNGKPEAVAGAESPTPESSGYEQPTWTEYAGIIRAVHKLALELEPDATGEGGFPQDRGRARVALVATVLIAHDKGAFRFGGDESGVPF